MPRLKLSLLTAVVLGFCGVPATIAAPSGTQLAIYQGKIESLGSLDQVARHLARFDVVVLSHVATMCDGTRCPRNWKGRAGNCLDVAYQEDGVTASMGTLIQRIRSYNEEVQIYGYVSATADSPQCYSEGKFVVKDCAGTCINFIQWVDEWRRLENESPAARVDGIFIDLVAPAYITAATRDNIISYVKLRRKKVMLNITSPSPENLRFAANSPYLPSGAGDYIFFEGFHSSKGSDASAGTRHAVNAYLRLNKRLRLAALSTLPSYAPPASPLVTCGRATRLRAEQAYAEFLRAWRPGNVFQLANADLGTSPASGNGLVFCDNDSLHGAHVRKRDDEYLWRTADSRRGWRPRLGPPLRCSAKRGARSCRRAADPRW
jgi:hypothetical protein